jgi:hypothetical protein
MAEFRNIEDDGNWYRGNTYTFEAKLDSSYEWDGPYEAWNPYTNACDSEIGQFYTETDQFVTDEFTEAPCALNSGEYTDNGNIFLDSGVPIDGIVLVGDPEELEDNWFRYTVTVSEDCPLGDIVVNTFLSTFAGFLI